VKLANCDGGPATQLSINPDGTIDDIQTGKKCFRDAGGGTLSAGSCSGTQSRWTFTPAGQAGLSVAVDPASASVRPGASTTAKVTVAGGSGTVALTASGVPSGVSVTFDPSSVGGSGVSTMTVAASASAKSGTFTVVGTAGSGSKSASFALTVGGGGPSTLLSQGKTATSSSVESSAYAASKAFDGNLTSTRWASKEGSDPQWLQVDLGSTHGIAEVKLTWEAAYGKAYTIQTSDDGRTWKTIYGATTGNGGVDDLTGLAGSGRYVRMNGTARGTGYGYSLYEMQVFGS
jgi:hypothetical protein